MRRHLAQLLPKCRTQFAANRRLLVANRVVVVLSCNGSACGDAGHEQRRSVEPQQVMIHLVTEARVAGHVCAWHCSNVQSLAIRKYQALPGNQYAFLSITNIAGVGANHASPLRNKQVFAGGRVIHVLRNLRHDLTWQIRVDAAQHDSRNNSAGPNLERCGWSFHFGVQRPTIFFAVAVKSAVVLTGVAGRRGQHHARRSARTAAAVTTTATAAHVSLYLAKLGLIGRIRIGRALLVDLPANLRNAINHFIRGLRSIVSRAGADTAQIRQGDCRFSSNCGLEKLHFPLTQLFVFLIFWRAWAAIPARRLRWRIRVFYASHRHAIRRCRCLRIGRGQKWRLSFGFWDQAVSTAPNNIGSHQRAIPALPLRGRCMFHIGLIGTLDGHHCDKAHKQRENRNANHQRHVVHPAHAGLFAGSAWRRIRRHLVGVSHGNYSLRAQEPAAATVPFFCGM